MKLLRVGAALVIVLAVVAPLRLVADNGAVAIGVPLQGIVLDGELSDWPEGIRRYDIARTPSDDEPPSGPDDVAAWFVVGYSVDENALYVGVEVQDESSVTSTVMGSTRWNGSDGVEIYVGVNGSMGTPGQWASAGNTWMYFAPADSSQWVPSMSHRPDGHTYEARFDLATLPEPIRLEEGAILALDVVVKDRDADGSFHLISWGRQGMKLFNPMALGDVLLTTASEFGDLHLAAPDASASGSHWAVVPEGSSETLTLIAQDGVSSVQLPVGMYQVSHGFRSGATGEQVEIRSGEVTEFEIGAVGAEGEVTPRVVQTSIFGPGVARIADPDRSTPAGAGKREGLFHNLNVGDGLPDGKVQDLLQDRDGAIWISTQNGVSRYDGQTWDEFTEEFAPARTFCFASELVPMLERGLIKGGSTKNALVFADVEESVLSSLEDRFGIEVDHSCLNT